MARKMTLAQTKGKPLAHIAIANSEKRNERKRAGGESRKSYCKQQQSMQNEAYLHRDQMHKIF